MVAKMHGLAKVLLLLVYAALPSSSYCAETTGTGKSVDKAVASKQIERGRYLVKISGCNDCHTPRFMLTGGKTPDKDLLTGSAQGFRGPWGTTYPDNLRLYFQELTEEQWIQVAKEIQRRPSMPYFSLNAMSEADVRAIYRYIKHLGPSGEPAPKFVPADGVTPEPYVQYVKLPGSAN
jgi:mono/diheme cytochrome c family protein